MKRVAAALPLALHAGAATRAIELQASSTLPDHELMQRAGLAVARLALAVAPHARMVWLACGPGNNGGDGLEAARHLAAWGKGVSVTWLGTPGNGPPDAQAAWQRACQAGIKNFHSAPPNLLDTDLCIDALLGLGASRTADGLMADCIARMNASRAPVLAVDLPTGLNGDTGAVAQALQPGDPDDRRLVRANWTLSLLTLKPGLFTGHGRDASGEVWFDDLGVTLAGIDASAMLGGPPAANERPHASHKGDYGDTVVLGGASGMAGAAVLAAAAALSGGAGRVYLCPLHRLDAAALTLPPELMLRSLEALDLTRATVVCGCGGGDSIAAVLPRVISTSQRLLLDADALNALAHDPSLQTLLLQRAQRAPQRAVAVLTPHPLEAARLLDCDTAAVQANRLQAAQELAERFQSVVLLKGSGTVIAGPGRTPVINPSGNARLATAGSGDVLAGMIGARLSIGRAPFEAACEAAFIHGQLADEWPGDRPLTASGLAAACCYPPRR